MISVHLFPRIEIDDLIHFYIMNFPLLELISQLKTTTYVHVF